LHFTKKLQKFLAIHFNSVNQLGKILKSRHYNLHVHGRPKGGEMKFKIWPQQNYSYGVVLTRTMSHVLCFPSTTCTSLHCDGTVHGLVNDGTVHGLMNDGTVHGLVNDDTVHGLVNDGTVHGLVNDGTVHGLVNDGTVHGLVNDGTVHGLVNDGTMHGLVNDRCANFSSSTM
jgi:hypothetical protein